MIPRTLRVLGVAALLAAPPVLHAQDAIRCDRDDLEITGLSFTGNDRFPDAFLANGIVSERSSLTRRWFRFFGKRRCFNADTLGRDVDRLYYLYRKSGFPAVRIDTTIRRTSPRKVNVLIAVREGAPTVVDTLRVHGLAGVPDADAITRKLPLEQGQPFDEFALAASVDSLTRRLQNVGYPAAYVLRRFEIVEALHATVDLEVVPGTRAHIGDIEIDVRTLPGRTQQISDETIRSLLGVKPGDLYRENRLQAAKRNMLGLGAFSPVAINVDSADVYPPGDSAVKVQVLLTEGLMHSARPSGGWGTLDCFRAGGDFRDNNVLGSARRLDLRASVSKIGIGRPLSGAASLCPNLRSDPYSTKLNYYAGATVTEPIPRIAGFRPSLTLFSERRSEYKAFLQTTPIGAALTATRGGARFSQTAGYQAQFRRTEAQPAVFCALQNLCRPEDREPLLESRWLSAVSWTMTQNWSDDPQYPSRGGGLQLEFRHASKYIGSDSRLQFSKATIDAKFYFALGGNVVLAPRIRLGAVVGPGRSATSGTIPQEERLFAGGGSTVRGFKPNELGSRVYIARGYDTVTVGGDAVDPLGVSPTDTVLFRTQTGVRPDRAVPTGGSALIVANLELRRAVSKLVQVTAFIDAGELWTPGAAQGDDRFTRLKLTPGIGLRISTIIGAIGFDVAYNPEAPRAGSAYFDTPIELGGQLYCVSPGNSLAVTGLNVAGRQPVQATGTCTPDFRPSFSRGFFKRLNLSLAIGQAY